MKTSKLTILFIVWGSVTLNVVKAQGQMAAARVMEYIVQKDITVNATMNDVWKQISDIKELPKYSGGFISAVNDDGKPEEFLFTLKDGTQRKGKVDIMNPEGGTPAFCVINVVSPFPDSITLVMLVLRVKEGDSPNTANIRWAASIDGTDKAKNELKQQLAAEFDSYIIGLSKFFQVKQQ
ncbi:MAG: hypothetical protein ABI237_18015 [Ginsengibacter sp.]